MRTCITSFGSTGDIQPLLALGVELRSHGHEVLFALAPNYERRLAELGFPFTPLGPDLHPLQREIMRRQMQGALTEQQLQPLIQPFVDALPAMFRELRDACRDVDVLVSAAEQPVGCMVHEVTGLPFASVHFAMVDAREVQSQQRFAALINPFRGQLGLRPISFAHPLTIVGNSPQLALYALSRHVLRPGPLWPSHYAVTGFFALEEETYAPDPALAAFLEDGPPPVAVSFGSMVHDDPEGLTELMLTVIERVGCRAVIQQGWSGLRAHGTLPPGVHLCGVVPHSWLFPRAACVIHHGGMGTTAAAFRAGVPSVVVPHLFDQFAVAGVAQQLGVAPEPVLYRQLSAPRLQAALQQALHEPRYRQMALVVRHQVRAEPGVRMARERIEQLVAAGV